MVAKLSNNSVPATDHFDGEQDSKLHNVAETLFSVYAPHQWKGTLVTPSPSQLLGWMCAESFNYIVRFRHG